MKLRLFAFFACLYVGIASAEPPWADAHVMYETAVSIVDRHRLDVTFAAPDFFFAIHDGKRYALNPPGNIVAHIPSYLAYKALAKIPGAPRERLYRLASHLSSALLMAGACVLFFALVRREGAGEREALALTLLLGAGTACAVYARVPYSEALQTLLLLWVVERALALGDRLALGGAAWAGVAAGLLLHSKVVNLFPIVAAFAYVVVRQRRAGRRLWTALAAAAAPFAVLLFLLLYYNFVRTASWLEFGYGQAAGISVWAGDFYDAVYGYLFSTGRSLFLYSPILILGVMAAPALARRDRGRALLLGAVFLALFLPHCKFHDWSGGWSWGPRYLAPLAPVVLLPAAGWLGGALHRGSVRLRRAAFALLAAASVAIQALGNVFWCNVYIRIAESTEKCAAQGMPCFFRIVFIPQYSPIVGHGWMLWHKVFGPAHELPDTTPWGRLATTSAEAAAWYKGATVDWWFTEWCKLPEAKTWALVILAVLLAGLGWSAVGLWRRARRRVLTSG